MTGFLRDLGTCDRLPGEPWPLIHDLFFYFGSNQLVLALIGLFYARSAFDAFVVHS